MALLYVAITLFGAIRMVGSLEDGGVLAEATGPARSAEARAQSDRPWYAPERAGEPEDAAPVFGDYTPEPRAAWAEAAGPEGR